MLILFMVLISVIFCCLPCYQATPIFATSENRYFARILTDDVMLYKTPNSSNEYTNTYFLLPKTYFVELLDETGTFFKANYAGFVGYVKKDSVQTILGSPKTPYLTNVNFRVFSEQSRDMRTLPSTTISSSSQVVYVPLFSRNLTFFGKIAGEAVVDERTNIWYFCKYSADKDYYGYVYSDFCDLFTNYTENTETVSYAPNPNFNEQEPEQSQNKLNNKATGIIIAVLMVPAFIFIFLLIKGGKLVANNKGKAKEIKDY